jgi:hypothetical protein
MDETTAFETLRHMMFNLGLRKQFHPSMMPLQVIVFMIVFVIVKQFHPSMMPLQVIVFMIVFVILWPFC